MSDPFELIEATPVTDTGPLAPPSPRDHYLDGLNETQRDAVEAIEGPVLVLAGAGTGKTRVLTTRFAHILKRGHARPWEIVAVTFTNKAALEMRARVAAIMETPAEGWWVGTFHALSARILRAQAEAVGLKPNFTILDVDDQLRLVKQVKESLGIPERRLPTRAVHVVIQRWKDRGLTPDRVASDDVAEAAGGLAHRVYDEYQGRLQTLNAVDFGDLLLHCVTLFQERPESLERYQNRFRYILVDEYQDTNVAQYLWLRLLAQSHNNICCVGDDDQSIYSWRGAEVGNILRFETDFPGARVIRLERNYRSTSHILAAASGLIAHNEGRLGKTLWTDVGDGERVRIAGAWDAKDEARNVCGRIEALPRAGHALDEIAVLVRTGFQTREFEERLILLGIPYRVVGGPRFYERREIRDAIAYLRVIVQADDDLAFERIVNTPKRGIGSAALATVHRLARAQGLPLTAAVARLVETDELKSRARTALVDLLTDFDRWRSLLAAMPHPELVQQLLDESGYTGMWQAMDTPDAPGRLENLKELVAALVEFESIAEFLEHVSLVMENARSDDDRKVTLMTLHSAKGLEFDTVFLPGWEEGLFPHQRALDEGGVAALEEERRLAYVGITRARHRASISFAANRQVRGRWQGMMPSRFLGELPREHLKLASEPGLYGADPETEADGRVRHLAEHRTVAAAAGWEHGRHRTRLVEATDGSVTLRAAPETPFEAGQRVFHQKFGYGRIVATDGEKLEVAFEKTGTKKVMDSFVVAV